MVQYDSLRGQVSLGFTQAYDTLATRRHLDVSARSSGEHGVEGGVSAKFVRVPNTPSGFATDVKLHTAYAIADPARWGGSVPPSNSPHLQTNAASDAMSLSCYAASTGGRRLGRGARRGSRRL